MPICLHHQIHIIVVEGHVSEMVRSIALMTVQRMRFMSIICINIIITVYRNNCGFKSVVKSLNTNKKNQCQIMSQLR